MGLQHRAQLSHRFQGGQGNHHHTAGAQTRQQRRQQLSSGSSTTTEQHPIGIGQLSQQAAGIALQHRRRLHR